MNTTVYLIRHSEKLDTKYIDKYYNDEFYQITRKKPRYWIITIL